MRAVTFHNPHSTAALPTIVFKVLTGSVSHCNGQKSLQRSPPRTHQGPRRLGAWMSSVPVTCCRTSHHNIPGIRYCSALCHKGGRTFGDLKPDVFVTPAMTFSAAKEGVTLMGDPEKLQFNGSKFLGAAGPVEQGKVTEGCEAQGYSQPGTSRRKMQPRKRSSALVRSQERAAAA